MVNAFHVGDKEALFSMLNGGTIHHAECPTGFSAAKKYLSTVAVHALTASQAMLEACQTKNWIALTNVPASKFAAGEGQCDAREMVVIIRQYRRVGPGLRGRRRGRREAENGGGAR
jgi:hypothetical protein